MPPAGPAVGFFLADGTTIQGLPATQAGPNGVAFVSTQVGRWEPTGPRSVHFTGIQRHSDAKGTYTGSVTIDGYPTVSEDGQTLRDDQSKAVVTIRDAAGAIVQTIPGAGSPPVTAIRISVGSPGFPTGKPTAATPTS